MNPLFTTPAINVVLSVVLAIGGCAGMPVAAYADEPGGSTADSAQTGTADYRKDQNVYGVLSSDGSVESLHVVNQFSVTKGGSLEDGGSYDGVTNLTDTSSIEEAGGMQRVSVDEGMFYYEGVQEGGAAPWDVSISYTLDGKAVSAQDLAGADGRVGVHVETKRNDAIGESVYFDKYLLQVTFAVPAATVSNIDTDAAGIVADEGQNKRITYMVMPGKEGNLTFEADASDFSMSSLTIAGAPFSMDVSGAFDTAGMMDGMTQLAEGVEQLADGTVQVSDGAASLSAGAGQLADGASSFADGAGSLSQGTSQFAEGIAALQQSVDSLGSGIARLSDGASQSAAGSSQFRAGLENAGQQGIQLAQGMSQTSDGMDGFSQALSDVDTSTMSPEQAATIEALKSQAAGLAGGMRQNADGAASYVAGVQALSSNYAALDDGLAGLSLGLGQLSGGVNGEGGLANGIVQLSDAASRLALGSAAMAGGASQLAGGVSDYAGGMSAFAGGTSDLAGGMTELSKETGSIPEKMQDQIDDALATFTDAPEPVDFVSADNTRTDHVQFALATPAIEKAETEAPTEEDSEPNFFERLVNLFVGKADGE